MSMVSETLDETIELASSSGYKAHQLRKTLDDNPYDMNFASAPFVAWRSGWYDSQADMMEAGGEFPIN